MLRSLRIRNFAVIEKLDMDFSGGLSVFTGETGAGKSILIEALGFLLGERGSTDWLRAGAPGLEVAGVFDAADFPVEILSKVPRLDASGKSVTLKRELDAAGRSRAYVDDRPAALKLIALLGERLADFHGQHDHQTLLKPQVQLELLDAYGNLGDLRGKTAAAFRRFSVLRAELEALRLSTEERLRRIDLYRFQLGEIDEVAPRPGEEEDLAAELPRLKNAEKLRSLADRAYGVLYEADGSAEECLRRAEKALEAMAALDPSLSEALAAVGRARGEIDPAAAVLARYRETAEAGPEALDELIGRQDKIARLKRKYGASIKEVLAYRDRVRGEFESLENHEARSAEKEAASAKAEKALRAAVESLHAGRRKAACRLSERVRSELKGLGLAAARLSVSVEMAEGEYSSSGSDRVEFLIAPNPGEPLKALRSIASGGELSRVMLGLKTVLARQDRVGLLIFDEVDTGVGGPVGRAVGRRLAELGRSRQVFCVTHLPQVACCARTHFRVAKSVSAGRTRARVERLEGVERVEAVAHMLGGRKLTPASLKHAKELMESV